MQVREGDSRVGLCPLVGRVNVWYSDWDEGWFAICRYDGAEDYSVARRFRFAAVDLDKGKNYPLNFVFMLPMRIDAD